MKGCFIVFQFQGFKTKKEAKDFQKKHGGLLCYEKIDIEPRGRYWRYYRDAVILGGMSREYPYCVQWNRS